MLTAYHFCEAVTHLIISAGWRQMLAHKASRQFQLFADRLPVVGTNAR
jgi:hypothetical protein